MLQHKIILVLFMLVSFIASSQAAPQLTSADQHALPEGETITITGSDLGDATVAHMLWSQFGISSNLSTTVNPLNANTLEVIMPEGLGENEHQLLVETSSGSTIGFATDSYIEHSTIGPSSSSPFFDKSIIVKTGAILRGQSFSPLILVEVGGVLEVDNGSSLVSFIIAEDGAVIDFSTYSGSLATTLYHSPDTVILGTIPAGVTVRQLTSIKPSYGFDPFATGHPINLTIVGDGTVSISPDQPYYKANSSVELTATPSANSIFSGWSGYVTSTTNTINIGTESAAPDITANFSSGWRLEIYDIPGVTVTISPDSPLYMDGDSVTLTASVEAGYNFIGWGMDASGASLSTSITMDAYKRVIPMVKRDDYDQLPQLTSADQHALPAGETITIGGTDLGDATAAHMLWGQFGTSSNFPTTVNPLNDNTFDVIMPEGLGDNEHQLLVETSSGSTIGFATDSYIEHSTIGPSSNTPFFDKSIIVKTGAVLNGQSFSSLILVESGGVLEIDNGSSLVSFIIAEDSAVIDFSTYSGSLATTLYHSPETVILGTIPAGVTVRQLTSIKPSYGFDPFTAGYQLNLVIDGPGSVTVTPEKAYYSPSEIVELAAIEDAGAYFIRWVGAASSHEDTINIKVRSDKTHIARFSTAPDYFSTWRLEHFTIEELQDISISAFDADPDRDSLSNAAEYAFGTDPRDSSKKYKLRTRKERIDGEFRFYAVYPRPKDALDVTYRILLSSDMVTWNFNGDDTDLVYSEEISVEPIDDENEEVTILLYPETDSPRTFFIKISAILFE